MQQSQEKGSDVNLATYLIHDAWRDLFDVAVVFSQDTDLNEPVRIVRDEIKESISVIVLDGKAPGKLSTFGSFVRHITPADLAGHSSLRSVPVPARRCTNLCGPARSLYVTGASAQSRCQKDVRRRSC